MAMALCAKAYASDLHQYKIKIAL